MKKCYELDSSYQIIKLYQLDYQTIIWQLRSNKLV